jgi:phage terminase small subunit
MEGPGRKSGASLAIAPVTPWARLEPPEHMGASEAALWRAVVATKPSEWFRADSAPVLEAYCQSVENYRRTAEALAATSPADLTPYKTLTELVTKQAGLVVKLATALRLTQQSRYTPAVAATADRKTATTRKPWETGTG